MKKVSFGAETGWVRQFLTLPDYSHNKWDIVIAYGGFMDVYYYIVYDEEPKGPFETRYGFWKLNVSKWWLIRKIQLWAIKKAFR